MTELVLSRESLLQQKALIQQDIQQAQEVFLRSQGALAVVDGMLAELDNKNTEEVSEESGIQVLDSSS